MSEQVGEAVNPGQAIYDALSDEAKAAVDALPGDVFAGETGRTAARFMASSAHAANEQNKALWSVQVSDGGDSIALNVAGVNAVYKRQHKFRVLVTKDRIGALNLEDLHAVIAPDQTYTEQPHAQLELDTTDLTDRVFTALEESHREAVSELMQLGYKVNHRWKWHRDDWRAKLALLSGVGLVAPSYVPEDRIGVPMEIPSSEGTTPGQAIYDSLSDEAKAAIDALPIDLFTDDEGIDHSQRFVDAIRLVHEKANECWAIVTVDENESSFVALNVSGTNVISLGDKYRFVVQRDLVSEPALDTTLQDFIAWDQYRTRKYLVQVYVDSRTSDRARAELDRVQELTLQRLAKGKIGVQGRNHRDDIRVKLAVLTGEDIPAPGYVPESTRGLAYGLRRVEQRKSAGHGSEGAEVAPLADALGWTIAGVLPSRFAAAGLTYTNAHISSFYTALQTKGFVILSGISGTGKSKIAQRFADMLPTAKQRTEAEVAENFVEVAVRPYMAKYKRIRLLNEVSHGLPIPAQGTSEVVPFSVDGEMGECRVWTRPEVHADVYIFPQGPVGDRFKSSLDGRFALRFHLDDSMDHLSLIEMRSEVPTQTLPSKVEPAPNHLFLPVRPDWRDGKALIGYHNPLSGEYVRTPFLEFVIAAADDYTAGNRNAFFVILDEMNLAHVEYYFADVLSVIESGRDDKGWTVEGIPLAVGEEDADLPESLRLPPNLYIVGTVNMDETTHPFSPKVLDRAFTIELTEVDFTGYPTFAPGEATLDDSEKQALLDAFTGDGQRYPRIDKGEIAKFVSANPRFRDDLQSLNTSLRRARMHFGYRVFDEIMQFVHNAERNGMYDSVERAFDHAVLMKVLPKFNGSRGKLQSALYELIHWCHVDGVMGTDDRSTLEAAFTRLMEEGRPFDQVVRTGEDSVEDNWRYPETGMRAALMMQDLYTDGFASFG